MTMKTMFLSHNVGDNCAKKKFQKPNILRRKTKVPNAKANVPSVLQTTLLTERQEKGEIFDLTCVESVDTVKSYRHTIPETQQMSPKHKITSYQNKSRVNTALTEPDLLCAQLEENVTQCAVINVESFLNDSTIIQSTPSLGEHNILSNLKRDWCLDFINEAQQIIIEDQNGSHLASLHAADESAIQCMSMSVNEPSEEQPSEELPSDSIAAMGSVIPVDIVSTPEIAPSFQCDIPECSKRFKSKERLTRHKRTHLPENGEPKEPRHITVECPARKRDAEEMEACRKIFLFREALTKHMKEDHSPEDAMYTCTVCNRRFFWCVGLRAHSRAHVTRAAEKRALPCQWPGCGRVFHQPCRLREHQRAHTGDKPYPCNYPNCNWSFRTASKLVRHARRHTGERRHACSLCGHAFPRREHLRKHTASHHALMHHCDHQGCQRRFVSVDALSRHIRSRHKHHIIDDTNATKPSTEWKDIFMTMDSLDGQPLIKSTTSKSTTPHTTTSETPRAGAKKRHVRSKAKAVTTEIAADIVKWKAFTPEKEGADQQEIESANWNYPSEEVEAEQAEWHVYSEAGAVEEDVDWRPQGTEDAEEGADWHAARTHCTWPLPLQPRPPDDFGHSEEPYTLEEDVQVELSEGSESNTYTIRSDLFLHGNVLTNEDSEHIPGASASADSGLSLLDAHPTVGLLQEDLMYTDAAVDESSFRVLLLNGDELV